MLLLLQAYADSKPAGRLPKPAHLAHGRPETEGCPVDSRMHDEMAVSRHPLNQSSRSRSSAPGLTAFRGSRLSSCPVYQFIVCTAEAKARLSSRAGNAIRSCDLIATACLLRPDLVGPAPLKDADSTVHGLAYCHATSGRQHQSLLPFAALPCSNDMSLGSQNCIFFQFRLLGFRQCPFGMYAMSVPVRLRTPGPGWILKIGCFTGTCTRHSNLQP